ncbi:MAG: YceI family protein [Deltaproteobacteria bacterium]|nr:YceI family protein [Deltaproteobacteria bacterium]
MTNYRILLCLITGFLAVAAAGCQPTVYLMPTPAVMATGDLNPFSINPDLEESSRVDVLFATNRMPLGDAGNVFFDPDSPEKSKFEFTVKVDSINTGIGKRDNHLRSDDFFAADKYPQMMFKSSRVTPAGKNKYILEGKMTVKDVTKDMRLEVVFLGQKENPFKKSKMVAGFETRFKINRLDFHVGSGKFYEMGVVDKDVEVLISLEAIRDK